jgi:predicted Zn-dependent peptidase
VTSSLTRARRGVRAFHEARLENGVRVVTAHMPWLSRAHVMVQLKGGPVHEDDATWGMSHFVEHMVFRGTDQHKDVHEIALFADAFGGDVAAATYRDRVTYDTRCDPDRLGDAFDLLASMIAAPRFSSLAVERSIVEEEISELFDDDGQDIDAENALFSRLFSGHVLARSIEGTPETLKTFDRAAVRAFHERMYVGDNVVIGVAGPAPDRLVVDRARKAFRRVRAGKAPPPGRPPPASRARARMQTIRTDAPQTSVRLCAPLPGFRHDDAAASLVLARLLDDGPASRLQAHVVDRDGLAYSVWAMADLYEDRGVLELGGSVRPDRVGELVAALARELRAVASRPPSPPELEAIALRYARDLRDSLDDPAILAESIGKGCLFADPFRPTHAVRLVASVTPADVQRLARAALPDVQLVLSGGPTRASTAVARAALDKLTR